MRATEIFLCKCNKTLFFNYHIISVLMAAVLQKSNNTHMVEE